MSKELDKTIPHFLKKKEDVFLKIHPDRISLFAYFKNEVENLKKDNQLLKEELLKVKEKSEYIKQLEYIKSFFTLYCITERKDILLFVCSNKIKFETCKFYKECKPRKKIVQMLETNK